MNGRNLLQIFLSLLQVTGHSRLALIFVARKAKKKKKKKKKKKN